MPPFLGGHFRGRGLRSDEEKGIHMIAFTVNGNRVQVDVAPDTPLL